MKNIRHSVFETNSSSTHSISISASSDGIYDTIVPVDGIITLSGGEFGWQWERFNDSLTKANYAAVFASSCRDGKAAEMLKRVVKDHTGAKEVVFNFSEDYSNKDSNYAYIDHDSSHVGAEAFTSEATLKDWIFNSTSWLFLGNDNNSAPPNFYDVDTEIKFKYELYVDGIDIVCKFHTKPNNEELVEALRSIIERHSLCSMSYNVYPNSGYEFRDYDFKATDGKMYNSVANINDGFITLYRPKSLYHKNEYAGESIGKSIEIKFSLVEI